MPPRFTPAVRLRDCYAGAGLPHPATLRLGFTPPETGDMRFLIASEFLEAGRPDPSDFFLRTVVDENQAAVSLCASVACLEHPCAASRLAYGALASVSLGFIKRLGGPL